MKLGTLVRITDPDQADACFAPVAAVGITSCQLAYKPEHFTREAASKIRQSADKHQIEISAHFCGYRDGRAVYDLKYGFCVNGLIPAAYRAQRLDYLLQGVVFGRWLGIEDMIIHAGPIPNNPFSADYPDLVAAMRQLASHAKSQGINILLETGAESPVTLLRLITEVGTGNVYVNLDTGNALMYGYANPVDALYTYGSYVRNIHGKDGLPPTDPYTLGQETALGQGEVDFPRLIQRLRSLQYDRFITIEREISGEEQKRDILQAKIFLSRLLEENGFSIN
ncbi:MAG: sugar phosphate isomerase/epimerase [Ruminococcaceae bacterium]|nr:sugar phosphate isomerase/epimerase [Oscillospiraceae bacterium]